MASNIYLDFNGDIKGDCSADNHKDHIEILSWSHGFSQPTRGTRSSGGAGTVEQANHQNLKLTKYLDAATAPLLTQCWSGKQLAKAILTCNRASGDADNKPVEYLKVTMEHVVIANYSVSGGPGGLPVENISLDYGILEYDYVDQKQEDGTAKGNMPAKHNLETRKIG